MDPNACRVRRATIEDLKSLVALWESMQFSVLELERHLTDFQVAEAPDGSLIGAIAMEIQGHHGRIHSEAFNDFSLADPMREKIWDRLHVLAMNRGLTRMWTQETAPFWVHSGFQPADEEALKKLPAPWAAMSTKWLTHALRAEEALGRPSVEKEFVQFMQAESAKTERMKGQARLMNQVAAVAAVILAFIVMLFFFAAKFRRH